ncbi:hypothetical protein LAZ67_20001565 [Cordylochernes scorpioides]|uniref:CCHC-type domain-containing protein n=1 Tax=Cordylochernes scorpioides TaxID=51811 RepID=A0ABY6LK86_9ARAC|nr:hypothetical protein LAZ67_20001565 [Cordylochernes scorpioides]
MASSSGTTFSKLPYRKRADKIVVGNFPIASRDLEIVAALRTYCRVVFLTHEVVQSASPIAQTSNILSKSHLNTEILPHQSTNDEENINMQGPKIHFTSEERKKFEENRKNTYERRNNAIKATIQFKPIQDASEEHLIAIADIIGYENIHSIGKINGQAIVSVANVEMAELLLAKGFKIRSEVILPSPLFRTSKKYILSGVLSFIQDKDIEKALEPYGHMISIRPIPFSTENPLLKHLSSLRREIVFKTKENTEIPAIISINYMDQIFKFFIGEGVTCTGCRRRGHIKTQCPFDPKIRSKVTKTFSEALRPLPQPDLPPTTEREPTLDPKDLETKKRTLEVSMNGDKSSNVKCERGKRPKSSFTGQEPNTKTYSPQTTDMEEDVTSKDEVPITGTLSPLQNSKYNINVEEIPRSEKSLESLTSTTSSQQDEELVECEMCNYQGLGLTNVERPREESVPAKVASRPPWPARMTFEDCMDRLLDLFKELNSGTILKPILQWTDEELILFAVLSPEYYREKFLKTPPEHKIILADFLGTAIERVRGGDRTILKKNTFFRKYLGC